MISAAAAAIGFITGASAHKRRKTVGRSEPVSPPSAHVANVPSSVAEEYAECCICYEPLCDAPCVSLHKGSARSCSHVMHRHCARQMVACGHSNCPECRAAFDSSVDLPTLNRDAPRSWFDATDANRDGQLSREEVSQALKTQFRLDWRKLEQEIARQWSRWDTDGSGEIDYREFCAPGGLLDMVSGSKVAHEFRLEEVSPPSLTDTRVWFMHWDEDNSGSLSRSEVERALVKTFRLNHNFERTTMQSTLAMAWGVFDTDGSGEIDLEEFTARDGLGDALTAAVG